MAASAAIREGTSNMRRPLIALSVLSLLAACGPKPEGKEKSPDANPSATVLTPANETAAPTFVEQAAMGDMFEIEAAKIAQARSANPEVKAFAAMMTDAHAKTTAALKTAAALGGVALPAAMSDDQQKKLDDLSKAEAKDFDKAYVDGQIDAHQTMLNLMSRYANDGAFGPLKTLAVETMGGVQAHLDSAKSLKTKLEAKP
jgi:putative membrane protein